MLKHQIEKIEWLIPIPDCTLEKAKNSNLASIRIRSALSAEAFSQKGLDVRFSDGHEETNADVVFIGKIDNISDPSRSDRWLNHTSRLKSKGCHIVVDYTDHHLNTDGPNKYFYQNILKLADTVTCSSRLLAKHLSNFGIEKPIIVHDPIEVDIMLPKHKSNQITTALWFGHATNLKYLVGFLEKLKKFKENIDIIALTNAYPIPQSLIEDLEKFLPDNINISFIPWSMQNLIDASTLCDCAIIPAGVNDDRKSGASSNRLLTSIALGLPTFADPLDSYLDFKEYFNELSSNSLLEFSKIRSESSFEKLISGQDVVKDGYTFSAISKKWIDLIEYLRIDDKNVKENFTSTANSSKKIPMQKTISINSNEFEDFIQKNFVLDKVGIDIVHGCQLRCVGCPNSILKPKIKYMTPFDFRKIIENINVKHVNLLRLFNFGEPLLHDDLPLILQELKHRPWTVSNIELSTNGQFHNFPVLEEAIKTKVLNTINVSCDGDGTPEEYERLRTPSRWSKFIEFVNTLSELRNKYDPNLVLMTRTICDDPIAQKRWQELLNPIGFHVEFRDWVYMPQSSENMTGKPIKSKEGICSFLKDGTRLYVDYDGTVVPCCVHPMAANLGNILNHKFSEILKGQERSKVLTHMKNARSEMPLCNECSF